MALRVDDRRSNAFSQAIASSQMEPEVQPQPVIQQVKMACQKVVSETPILLAILATATLFTILLVRPPFALKFEQDQRRPWRGCTRISWSSVAVAVFLVSFSPLLLRFIMTRGRAAASS